MKNQNLLTIVFLTLATVLIAAVVAFATPAEQTQIVNIGSSLTPAEAPSKVGSFLVRYWESIALVASEVLAFVPAKFNGLAHAVLQVGKWLFSKKG